MMREGQFTASGGARLYERRFLAADLLQANVAIIHGYGDHCARYDWVMGRFRDAGVSSFSYDQRGHGRSPGKRGYVFRFEDFLDDLEVFLRHIAPDLGGRPLFLMGHSMGAMVLARYAQTRVVAARGMVFSSPFLAFNDDVPKFLMALGPYIARVAPWLPAARVDTAGLSRDSAVIAAAEADPLGYHGRVAIHTGAEFYRTIQAVERDYSRITTPALILHGADDRIVSVSGARALYEHIPAADKTLDVFEGGYHELWNDLEKERFISEVIAWVSARA